MQVQRGKMVEKRHPNVVLSNKLKVQRSGVVTVWSAPIVVTIFG